MYFNFNIPFMIITFTPEGFFLRMGKREFKLMGKKTF